MDANLRRRMSDLHAQLVELRNDARAAAAHELKTATHRMLEVSRKLLQEHATVEESTTDLGLCPVEELYFELEDGEEMSRACAAIWRDPQRAWALATDAYFMWELVCRCKLVANPKSFYEAREARCDRFPPEDLTEELDDEQICPLVLDKFDECKACCDKIRALVPTIPSLEEITNQWNTSNESG